MLHIYTHAVIASVVGAILYGVTLAFIRLWLSPIATFPGPKLAALTFWYEFYYDWIQTGQYYRHIKQLHARYGPIIRISPDELHIDDASYYDNLYVSSVVRRSNNYQRFCRGTGFEDMVEISIDHDSHRAGIAPLTSFFSHGGIIKIESRITAFVRKLVQRLDDLAGDDGRPVVNLSHAFNSYANDVVSSVLFKDPSDFMSDPDFNGSWYETVRRSLIAIPLFSHLPWLARIVTMPLLGFLMERSAMWQVWDNKARREILNSRLRPAHEAKNRDDATVFDHLVHSDLKAVPFSLDNCPRVAQLIQQVGTFNSGRSLETIVTLLCLNKEKQDRLRDSLRPLFQRREFPSWRELENVPYLTACIQEGIRLAIGNMLRAPRISPDEDLYYKGWKIPKGTPVSMTTYWMHMDPTVFVNPYSFEPERWLESSPEKLRIMKQYFVPFAKGSRVCLGQHLALMELYHAIAHLFRPGAATINLYETDESDVMPVHGLLFAIPRKDSPGVRAYMTKPVDN